MPNEKTSYLELPLPHPDNTLDEDVTRLRQSFTALDANAKEGAEKLTAEAALRTKALVALKKELDREAAVTWEKLNQALAEAIKATEEAAKAAIDAATTAKLDLAAHDDDKSDDKAISPAYLATREATEERAGLVKLAVTGDTASAKDAATPAGVAAQVAEVANGVAPRPSSTSGLGAWIDVLSALNAAYTLPSGGTWAYWLMQRQDRTGGTMGSSKAGVAAGGTLIGAVAGGYQWVGFVWRIA